MMTNQQMSAYKENIVKEKKKIKEWDKAQEKRITRLTGQKGVIMPPAPSIYSSEVRYTPPPDSWIEKAGLNGPTMAAEVPFTDPRRQFNINNTGYTPPCDWQRDASSIRPEQFSDSYKYKGSG